MFKYLKNRLLWIALLTTCIVALWKHYENWSSFEIPITFSKNIIPLVQVDIEGKQYPLEFSLAFKYPLYISEENLNGIQKSRKGLAQWKNIKGEQQQAPLFEIKKVQLGALKLKNILTTSKGKNEESGLITWPFDKMNLLLDFPHRRICGIKNEKDLKSFGFNLKKMHKIKCKIDKKGICFNSETSIGELKLYLSTNCNCNAINNSIYKGNTQDENYFKTNLKIAGKNYGINRFFPFEITPELEANAILGVEFLNKHVVYIDARNEYLYFGEKHGNTLSKNFTSKIPVDFTVDGLPVIDVEVAKKQYQAIVDLGSSCELILPTKNFQTDGLRHVSTSSIINALGEEQERDSYVLPKCCIGNFILKNLLVSREDDIGVCLELKSEDLGTIKNEHLGNIGHPLLHRTNIYFDFANSSLWFVNRDQDLNKIEARLEEYVKIPFDLENCGIVLKIKNDLGTLRFLIDTGATISIIKTDFLRERALDKDSYNNSCFKSSTFVLGNYDYGKKNLYPFDITPKLRGFDGVLGMDFLREHAFYIDFQNRFVYFQKPHSAEIHLKKAS
ncbi:MAG: hypothetical protein K1000chlam3_00232 [Chlamydiae bacterium]|nr:hypothetical protein [Chlamydiota bacterium]